MPAVLHLEPKMDPCLNMLEAAEMAGKKKTIMRESHLRVGRSHIDYFRLLFSERTVGVMYRVEPHLYNSIEFYLQRKWVCP